MTAVARRPSLQRTLLRHVLLSLGVSWILGTAVALTVSHFFTQRAFDRSVLDDAYLLASGVHAEQGELRLQLTPGEVKAVRFDRRETILFSVRTEEGRLVAGDASVPALQAPQAAGHRFHDVAVGGTRFRAVTLRLERPRPFVVTVAQSTSERTDLLRWLLFFCVVPQLALLAWLAWHLRRTVASDLAPLSQLTRAVAEREAGDFRPVAVRASTEEICALSESIDILLDRLESSANAQREFTGNVAHELRTPLAGIRALAEYGLRHSDPQVWLQQLRGIAEGEARASSVLDKLLAVALAYEARTALHLVALRLDEVVQATVVRFLSRADRQGVDLGAEGLDAPAWVLGDVTLVEGILTNLLDNALRHGVADAAEHPMVTVGVRREGAKTILWVQDNGPGIPEHLRKQMLKRGQRGPEVGGAGGVGLALVTLYAQLLKAQVSLGGRHDGAGWRCEVELAAASPPPIDVASGSATSQLAAVDRGSQQAAV